MTPQRMIVLQHAEDCGMGRGAECCAYLVAAPKGLSCGRTDPYIKELLEEKVARHEMHAARLPKEPIPFCQIFGEGERFAEWPKAAS
jgi:hypothetical protein